MGKTKHTLEPWEVIDDLAGVPSVVRLSETLKMVQVGNAIPGEVEANAQLAASAPETTEVLELIMDSAAVVYLSEGIHDKAVDAIAKARGE